MDFNQLPDLQLGDNNSWFGTSSNGNSQLQEPVPFEDFKFSFGMHPDNNIPFMDPFLQEPFNFETPSTNTVLDEDDQKAFSSFLDTFFLDPPQSPSSIAFNNTQQHDFYHQYHHQEQEQEEEEENEENRRNSILQSLDEQKRLHQKLNIIASLAPTKTANNDPMIRSSCSAFNNKSENVTLSDDDNSSITPQTIYLRTSESIASPYRKRYYYEESTSSTESTTSSIASSRKKSKPSREVLTEEEKRANHIASEQKRRTTIRTGFKDLTDLVPTLKNINNSKSTVLFKAVEFIRYLEKRNKNLKEKVGSLELRAQVEGRMTQQHTTAFLPTTTITTSTSTIKPPLSPSETMQEGLSFHKHIAYSPPNTPPHAGKISTSAAEAVSAFMKPSRFTVPSSPVEKRQRERSDSSIMKGLPANARNALLAHKTQQKQLLLLQEQLQMHQRLIAQQQEMKEKSIKQHRQLSKNKLPPILSGFDPSSSSNNSSLLTELEDKTILSAP